MADDTAPTEAVTVPTADPTWVAQTDAMVKALLQAQRPTSVPGQVADTPNPWLQAPQEQQAAPQMPSMPSFDSSYGATPHPLHTPGSPTVPLQPIAVPQLAALPHVPVANVLQLGQHQLNPAVEAAKQRVVQALLQRPHGIVPQPVAKG